MAKTFQVTLALLKPDVAGNPKFVNSIERLALAKKFYIVKRKQTRWNRLIAEEFYSQHKQKFFYDRLVGFMSSGPLIALLLARNNAIDEWRNIIGPTKVQQARFTHSNTIRGCLGLTDTRNTVHGSDSLNSVKMELQQVFPDFNLEKWQKNEGRLFEQNFVTFNAEIGVHEPIYDNYKQIFRKSTDKEWKPFDMSSTEAWSQYYRCKTTPVDWFAGYEQLQEELDDIFRDNPSYQTVVDLGCGSSLLGPKLADAKPLLDIFCIDSSLECLQTLGETCQSTNCTFAVSDIRKSLPFQDHSVDLIIDKGTSDAISKHKDGATNVKLMLSEANRVLQRNGTLLQVTTEPPEIKLEEIKSHDETAKISYKRLAVKSNDMAVYSYKVKFAFPCKNPVQSDTAP